MTGCLPREPQHLAERHGSAHRVDRPREPGAADRDDEGREVVDVDDLHPGIRFVGHEHRFGPREREPRGRGFTVYIEPLAAPLQASLEEGTLQISQAMEQVIRQCPAQYLWGYGRYKVPRGEALPDRAGAAPGGTANPGKAP